MRLSFSQLAVGAVVACLSIGAATRPCSAVTFTVDATDNIFGAGHSTAPNPSGGSGGLLPPTFSLPTDAVSITFSDVTGSITLSNGVFAPYGPDGGTSASNIGSVGGISGIQDGNGVGFLTGVFMSNSEPADPAPSPLNVTGDTNFSSISPVLDQTFFIGDGLTGTGSGTTQTFFVPVGATRLALGFADANNYNGLPGQYQDNAGSESGAFSVAVATNTSTVVPLPAAVWPGLAMLAVVVGVFVRRQALPR
jgi:hypothetical protein